MPKHRPKRRALAMLGALLIVVSMSTLICATAAAPLPASIASSDTKLTQFQRAIAASDRSAVNAFASSSHAHHDARLAAADVNQNHQVKAKIMNLHSDVSKTMPNSHPGDGEPETIPDRTIASDPSDSTEVNELNLASANVQRSSAITLNGPQPRQQRQRHRDQPVDRASATATTTDSLSASESITTPITAHTNHTSVFLDYLNILRTRADQIEIDSRRRARLAYRRNLSRSVRSLQSTERTQRRKALRNGSKENSERIERSANLSLTKATKRIQIMIKSRLLQVLPDGTVNGTHDDESDYSKCPCVAGALVARLRFFSCPFGLFRSRASNSTRGT